jgi:hypothetical protein
MWNLDFMPMWMVFFALTLFIGADFVWVTFKSKVRRHSYLSRFVRS